jgi:DNA-binding MarR family transcriptional regulator
VLRRLMQSLERSGLVQREGAIDAPRFVASPAAVAQLQAYAGSLASRASRAAPQDSVDARARAWGEAWPYPADAYAIGQRLLRLASHVERALKDAAAAKDLMGVDLLLLDSLALVGPPWTLTPTQLQDSLLLTKGGITKCISRLEAQGLVERRPDPEDGRGVLVRMTPKARKLMRELVDEFRFGTDFVATLQMPDDRRAQLAALLREMLALADAEAERRAVSVRTDVMK